MDNREKSRLLWKCRRGMLELDLLLQKFIANEIDRLTENQLKAFDNLLTHNDPSLYAWLMGHEEPEKELLEIVSFIRNCD
ncbi:TPA: succinate dehydrogenase assembly factor 2 [Legionella pneumophila]|uniref:FAD assembly factor SdhE n=2 Tax=Legionella pneumophila TaxID=446 RepID=SDHE_LEGPA|nr:succinate dehydrogenase assembly factor 2 [Legionella pneumophila]Q5X4Y4.1 RecName: Full=FAD assembly factor SdhE [Legionella pneumophila str. Paris]MCW8391810.1 succinate dehydrogenase assembly factor 2 [Legionella pneumophila]MCW8404806.1 succinate dehydrogenase assembly factor 2 [Legionella pneumophila]MCW8431386.1 succinate dehydrogenase assembly factor 2 [Legionella pneumophila]MCW8440828.1 succinate dehydrogenase assembly factor 2 [Legionella pneumophila]MCW8464574.1 succinate dehydr